MRCNYKMLMYHHELDEKFYQDLFWNEHKKVIANRLVISKPRMKFFQFVALPLIALAVFI